MGSGDRRNSQTLPFHSDGTPSPSDREVSTMAACDRYIFGFFVLRDGMFPSTLMFFNLSRLILVNTP